MRLKKGMIRYAQNGRKGNAILDTVTIVVLLFVFIIICITMRPILDDVNTDVQADADIGTEAKTTLSKLNTSYPTTMDACIILGYVLLWIFAVVASFMVDTHPAFLAVSIILMLFLVLISSTLANTYEELASDPGILAETYFPLTTFIMKHLVEYFIVVCASIMIVLYGKSRA
jgi:uncharacterized membrane protein YhaH (DUF805 family)